MLKRLRGAPAVALFVFLSCTTAHPPVVFRDVDAAIRKELTPAIPSIAIAIAKDGAIVHEAAFGFADVEAGRPATVNTPYPLASVTKPFVATAVMQLAERKKLALDSPATATAPYTIRQLLNHTSGLPTYARIQWSGEPSPALDRKTVLDRYGFTAHAPGTVSEYSNLGYGLLGDLVATSAGESLSAYLEREVFRPLKLQNTVMLETATVPPGFARKYDTAGKLLPETFNDTAGAGNLYASVNDLVRFGMFHLDERPSAVLSPRSKSLMRTYVEPGALYPYYNSSRYGLGWYFRTTAKGTRVVWHEGGMPGASSMLVLLPEQNIVAAVVINANDRNDVAQSVVNRLIAAVDPSIEPLTFDPTEGFVAYDAQPEYRGRWEGTLTVDGRPLRCVMTFEEGGKVTVTFPDQPADALLPRETAVKPLLNGNLLLGTIAATLPGADIVQQPGGYVLLRLIRRNDELSGTMIAYSSPEGLRYLLPFPVTLRRSGAAAIDSFDAFIDEYYKPDEPGGVVFVAKGDQLLYERALGMANLELGVAMPRDAVFSMASITKQFTAVAILQQIEKGTMALTDTVGKFLPTYPDALKSVTIEQLLGHTGGVPAAKSVASLLGVGRGWLSAAQVMSTFKDQPLDFPPGTRWQYSNSGYQLLGLILETVTGKPYAEFIEETLLQPAGMTRSFYGNDMKIAPNRASPYLFTRRGWENAVNSNVQIAFAAGALQGTAGDFLKWHRALLGGTFIRRETLEKAWTRTRLQDGTPTDYGFGWFIGELQGSPVVEHGGNMGGFMSHAIYLPREDILVGVFLNSRGKRLPEQIATDIAAAAIGKPLNMKPVALPEDLLTSYTGRYKNSENIDVVIGLENGKLFYLRTGGQKMIMIPYAKDKVYFENTSAIGEVRRDAQGAITGIAVQTLRGTSKSFVTRVGPPQ